MINMETSGATFSNGIRIFLYRIWNTELPIMNILMFFPSTANENENDTTIDRIINIAKFNNYGGIYVFNIFGGDDFFWNVMKIKIQENPLKMIVVAWGNKISKNRSVEIINKLKQKEIWELYCFKKNKNNNPSLPTRLPINTNIIKF